MRILAIIGSAREGNSYQMTKMIEARMHQQVKVEFDYMFLKDQHLGDCKGCHTCIKTGEDKCPIRDDDRRCIEEKMFGYDGIIFVSPIYSLQITYLMKKFLDLFSYLIHRPRFFGKKAMIVVVRGENFGDAIKYLSKVIKAWGFHVVSTLGIMELESLTPFYKDKSVNELNQATDLFIKSLQRNENPKISLFDLIWFRIWRLNALALKEALPADYDYWQERGWFDKNYYTDDKINPVLLWLSRLIEKLIISDMKKKYKGY